MEFTLWPTKVWLDDLGLPQGIRSALAAIAARAVIEHRAGPLPWQRVWYDIYAYEDPAIQLLKNAQIEIAKRYLRGLGYETAFDIRVNGWANAYRDRDYLPSHAHQGDLTAIYYAQVPPGAQGASAVTDTRVMFGFGRGADDWATRYVPMKEGHLLLHPSAVWHHHAPVLSQDGGEILLISTDFYCTPKAGEVVAMSEGCDLDAYRKRVTA